MGHVEILTFVYELIHPATCKMGMYSATWEIYFSLRQLGINWHTWAFLKDDTSVDHFLNFRY